MSENFDKDLSEVAMRLMALCPTIEGNQFVCAATRGSTMYTKCSLSELRARTAETFPIGSRGRLQTELLQRAPSVVIGETDGETGGRHSEGGRMDGRATCFRRV